MEEIYGNAIDESGALLGYGAAVAGGVEVLLDFGGLGGVRLAQNLARS
jgi:hypothetical protein